MVRRLHKRLKTDPCNSNVVFLQNGACFSPCLIKHICLQNCLFKDKCHGRQNEERSWWNANPNTPYISLFVRLARGQQLNYSTPEWLYSVVCLTLPAYCWTQDSVDSKSAQAGSEQPGFWAHLVGGSGCLPARASTAVASLHMHNRAYICWQDRRRLQSASLLYTSSVHYWAVCVSTVVFGIVSTRPCMGWLRVTLKQVGVVRQYIITGIANATKKAECMYVLSPISRRNWSCPPSNAWSMRKANESVRAYPFQGYHYSINICLCVLAGVYE
jgi:hypothetical protein